MGVHSESPRLRDHVRMIPAYAERLVMCAGIMVFFGAYTVYHNVRVNRREKQRAKRR
jgi:hypothetical protein